jgi:hypothetical protein
MNFFPEMIYAGSEALAFGKNYYYDVYEGLPLGTFGYASTVYYVSDEGKHVWAFDESAKILHHYFIGIPPATKNLESVEIVGPAILGRKMNVPYAAIATYNDGSKENVSSSVTWLLSSSTCGVIDPNGVVRTFNSNQPDSFIITVITTFSGVTFSANKTISYTPAALTYYIDAENGSDENDGLTSDTAFATIMKGVRESFNGDKIKLNPGTYVETIDYLGKAICISSTADAAVISGNSSQKPVVEDSFSTMDVSAAFGGVVFENQETEGSILENVVIRNFYCGIYCGNSSPTIRNVTVVNNAIGVIAWDNASPSIRNSIFWYNSQNDLDDANASYSCVQTAAQGIGNISENPLFVDPANNDYHLQSRIGRYNPLSGAWVLDNQNSLCIDKGSPEDSPTLEPQPNGGLINMGAYGGTAYASKSSAEWLNSADINRDGIVNFKDLAILVDNWLWQAAWY